MESFNKRSISLKLADKLVKSAIEKAMELKINIAILFWLDHDIWLSKASSKNVIQVTEKPLYQKYDQILGDVQEQDGNDLATFGEYNGIWSISDVISNNLW